MAIYYISATGSDTTGSGTSGSPYQTVEKCLTVATNGDTIKAMSGTYSVTSTINVTKQVTITSNTGVKTDVIFSGTTIFNIQNSNVNITYITLQTNSVNELISIDRMSTGQTIPTFFTGSVISNCNIKYVTRALVLNGSFTVNNNVFTRMSGTNVATIITVYGTRLTSSINLNTFTDSSPVQYILYFSSSTGSGTYIDYCNSKGGSITITSNTINYTYASQVTSFIYFDYFNQYINATGSNYNINTKLALTINSNNVSTKESKFIVITITSNLNMFSTCNINNNTVNNTGYGVIHLDKPVDSTTVTIQNDDLTRNLFKIYSNVLTSYVPTINNYNLVPTVSTSTSYYADNSTNNIPYWTTFSYVVITYKNIELWQYISPPSSQPSQLYVVGLQCFNGVSASVQNTMSGFVSGNTYNINAIVSERYVNPDITWKSNLKLDVINSQNLSVINTVTFTDMDNYRLNNWTTKSISFTAPIGGSVIFKVSSISNGSTSDGTIFLAYVTIS
jgi:hypothetical protein